MERPPQITISTKSSMEKPLLSDEEPASSSTSLFRISTVVAITFISLWANHEASKNFAITVLEAPAATPASSRYNLMFVANGAAVRAILNASASIECALYPDAENFPRKPVSSVILTIAGFNLSRAVIVTAAAAGSYVIHVSPDVIEKRDAVVAAVCSGMARVWLRDGRGEAPAGVVDAVVAYICGAGGFAEEADSANGAAEGCEVAVGFVKYCEERMPGFVARLNKALEERWEDGMLEKALGASVRVMCAGFRTGLDRVQEGVGNSTGSVAELQVG